MSVELRMIPLDRITVREGHNARLDVGDVSELADSIKSLGVLQALTVEELPAEDGQPAYALIAGERRLTAARQVGLDEVPCQVRRGLDDTERTAAMLVENLQRQDLAPLEEAAGIRRLVELGLSQREIARRLGCSQGQVSKRLSLLELPEAIRSAIGQGDSDGITVAEALELAKLADHPELQARAFEQGRTGYYGGVTGTAKHALAEVERQRRRADARAELQRAGVRILKEERYYSWYGRKEKPLQGCGHDSEVVALTPGQHQGEPCHAAAIDLEGRIIYVCRQPERHLAEDQRLAAKVERERAEKARRTEADRLRQQAALGRREAIARLVPTINTSHLPFAVSQLLSSRRTSASTFACDVLGLDVSQGPYGRDHDAALAEHAGQSMGAAIRVVLAMALAYGEERLSWEGQPDQLARRHLELLATMGYEPNESDRCHLTGERRADDQGEDDLVC